jgi:hypothetical protein
VAGQPLDGQHEQPDLPFEDRVAGRLRRRQGLVERLARLRKVTTEPLQLSSCQQRSGDSARLSQLLTDAERFQDHRLQFGRGATALELQLDLLQNFRPRGRVRNRRSENLFDGLLRSLQPAKHSRRLREPRQQSKAIRVSARQK